MLKYEECISIGIKKYVNKHASNIVSQRMACIGAGGITMVVVGSELGYEVVRRLLGGMRTMVEGKVKSSLTGYKLVRS